MTLDEAILKLEQSANMCDACGQEHAQLAAWLRELKERREHEVKWIPVTMREPTEDESKYYAMMFTCDMPNDEQDILVTVKPDNGWIHIEMDQNYIEDGFHLDSGYSWGEDVIAWMPLPEPYKAKEENYD